MVPARVEGEGKGGCSEDGNGAPKCSFSLAKMATREELAASEKKIRKEKERNKKKEKDTEGKV